MVKADKDYLIGTNVVIETICLQILGMTSKWAMSDLAMLRWIACLELMTLVVHHILGKNNSMMDMLSKTRYEDEDHMVSEDEGVILNFFKKSWTSTAQWSVKVLNNFNKSEYEGEWLYICNFLTSMTTKA